MSNFITLIPIYQDRLTPLEEFSLKQSLSFINPKNTKFICPSYLDKVYYISMFPQISFETYDDEYFQSIQGYNKLLLNKDFYSNYLNYEFILILQSDAILINDLLKEWINSEFDYIGAPWPNKFKLNLKWDLFAENNYQVEAAVGNGGLSLRRVRSIIRLINEFPQTTQYFLSSTSSEDLFYSTAGLASHNFKLPNEIVASKFSLEMEPNYYFHRNGFYSPLGGHAWWKYDPQFWIPRLREPALGLKIVKQFYNL